MFSVLGFTSAFLGGRERREGGKGRREEGGLRDISSNWHLAISIYLWRWNVIDAILGGKNPEAACLRFIKKQPRTEQKTGFI